MYTPNTVELYGTPIVCIDFETLNLTPLRVSEFAAVMYKHGASSAKILADVKKPSRAEIDMISLRAGISLALNSGILLGYNLRFDWDVIRQLTPAIPKQFIGIDVLQIVRFYEKRHKGRNTLSDVCARYDIEFTPHRALDDSIATIKLFRKLVTRYQILTLHKWYRTTYTWY